MGQPAEMHHRATYADLEAVPPGKVAEIVDGELYVFPRPAPRHANTASSLGAELHGPFQRGRGGPGGWWLIGEPELHLPDPEAAGDIQALVPDFAGWRRERMPELPETAYFPLAPDWVCEVLSPSTASHDRERKMPLYARHGVRWAWLIDPIARRLEVYALGEDRRWGEAALHRNDACIRAVPFEALKFDLSALWG